MSAKVLTRVTNAASRSFNIVLICKGDRYGLNDKLVHDQDEPMIEFWDATYENDSRFTKGRGQFVQRYNLKTLSGKTHKYGLDLYGGEPAWKVTGSNVDDAIAAANAALRDKERKTDNRIELEKARNEDHERRVFGCTAAQIDEALAGKDPRDVAMYATGVLSDAQELIASFEDLPRPEWTFDTRHKMQTIRQLMNVAKYTINKAVPR